MKFLIFFKMTTGWKNLSKLTQNDKIELKSSEFFKTAWQTTQKKLVPCPSTGPKIVCASSPNFLSHTKIYLDIVPFQKSLCKTKIWFAFSPGTKIFGVAFKCTSIFGLAQNIWTSPKHFGTWKRTRHRIASASSRSKLFYTLFTLWSSFYICLKRILIVLNPANILQDSKYVLFLQSH